MGSGFESQGAHIKENPADSSESAGFLRSLNNALSRLEVHIILFAPAGDPSSQSSDTLMSRQRIYAPPRVSVFGVRCGPAGVAVDARWFSVCAPCLANWGGGRLSPFSLLRDSQSGVHRPSSGQHSWVRVRESPPQPKSHSGQSFQKVIRLQDRPNPRHKLTEILHVLTLLQ